jgi:hypothetical protein
MTTPFLAMIIPIAAGAPTHPIAPGGPPPTVWPDPGHPAHPIAPGGQPPGYWGGAPLPWPTPPIYYPPPGGGGQPPGIWPSPGHPAHPIAPGGPPPGIWPSPGHPAHPIAPGGSPPGIWGGGNMPVPTPPIYLPPGSIPGAPTHPIYIPPSIWPSPGVPTHPIVLPPDGKPEVLENWDVKVAWSPTTGWMIAVVPSEQHPGVPTPS